MYKSTFIVKKMDCPSEKSLIEIKLGPIQVIKKFEFNFDKRELTIYHSEKDQRIFEYLTDLKLDSELKTVINIHGKNNECEEDHQSQKKLLKTVLYINLIFFIFEMSAGIISNSMGLVADSLDMFSDSIVYLISLFAVGGTVLLKKNVAKMAGFFQILLAAVGLIEVLRRFFGFGEIPHSITMMVVAALAFTANMYCLYLFQKSNSKEAHMKASWIFTSNDLIINTGVLISGILVLFFNSNIPDLIVGGLIFIIVIHGAIKILKLSK